MTRPQKTLTLALGLFCIAGCGDDAAPALDAALAAPDAALDATEAGPVTFESCSAEVGIPSVPGFEPNEFYQMMDFTNEELDLRMRVAISPGPLNISIGLAINFETRSVAVENADGLTCVRDEAQLTYDQTLHNENDSFTAMLGPDERYVVSMVYDWPSPSTGHLFTDTLTIEHPQSGAPTEGPYPLTQAGCSMHREDGVSDCTYQIREPY